MKVGFIILLLSTHRQQNPCQSNPCIGSRTTCLTGYTHEGYRCKCISGFKGEFCKEGTRLVNNHNNNHNNNHDDDDDDDDNNDNSSRKYRLLTSFALFVP